MTTQYGIVMRGCVMRGLRLFWLELFHVITITGPTWRTKPAKRQLVTVITVFNPSVSMNAGPGKSRFMYWAGIKVMSVW